MALRSLSEIDHDADAIAAGAKAVGLLRAVEPFIADVEASLVMEIARDATTCSSDRLRALAGSLAGLRRLRSALSSRGLEGQAAARRRDGT